jgi:hypothetical protein
MTGTKTMVDPVELTNQSGAPATTTDMLYQTGTELHFGGEQITGLASVPASGTGLSLPYFDLLGTSILGNSGIITGMRSAAADSLSMASLICGDTQNAVSSSTGAIIAGSGGIGCGLDIYAGGNVTATQFISSSDKVLKKDISPLKNFNKFDSLNPVSFKWKKDDTEAYGVIAQELQQVYPHMVKLVGSHLRVDYMQLIAVLISEVQELKKKQ